MKAVLLSLCLLLVAQAWAATFCTPSAADASFVFLFPLRVSNHPISIISAAEELAALEQLPTKVCHRSRPKLVLVVFKGHFTH